MTVVEPRLAACAILVRWRGRVLEVLLGRRSPTAAFLPGLTTFPGGAVDPADVRRVRDRDDRDDAAARRAALRELLEEAGLAAGAAGARAEVAAARAALLARRVDEATAVLDAAGLGLDAERAWPAGRWVTPAYSPIRFDTRFYLLEARDDEGWPAPSLEGGELDRLAWWRPREALRAWGRAELMLGPPAVVALRALDRCEAAGARDLEAAARSMRSARGADGRESQRWEVVPGVFAMPFRTPTLPPATHTNAYVLGSREAVLVEPASPHADEQDRLVEWLDELRDDGVEVREMLVTHHHPDHVGGATELRRRLGVKLRAHELTAARLRGVVPVDARVAGDEVLELDGPDPVRVRAVHTPGHAPGHLCFLEERSGALLAGDMVASVGTILIEPVDGDLQLYLDSLRSMGRLGATVLLPAHGFPIPDPASKLDAYLEHRLMRERKVLQALAAAAETGARSSTPVELLPVAYDDAPASVWPIATLSLQAHLLKLEREGRAVRSGPGWRLAP